MMTTFDVIKVIKQVRGSSVNGRKWKIVSVGVSPAKAIAWIWHEGEIDPAFVGVVNSRLGKEYLVFCVDIDADTAHQELLAKNPSIDFRVTRESGPTSLTYKELGEGNGLLFWKGEGKAFSIDEIFNNFRNHKLVELIFKKVAGTYDD